MFSKIRNTIRVYPLPILSGFLIGTSYIPFPPWALLFCLVPLFVHWSRAESAKQAFWGGWITQFILNAIGFHWIAYTTVEFGHLPWPVGLIVLLFYCTVAHLYYPISGWIWFRLQQRFRLPRAASIMAMVLVFALIERLYPFLFPWHLGYPWLWADLPGAQAADLIGFEGLNVLTLLMNGMVALAVLNWRHVTLRLAWFSGTLALFVAINLTGWVRVQKWNHFDSQLNVLAVQGNIGNLEKIYAQKGAGYQEHIVRKFLDLSRQGLQEHPNADVLMWPETAFPEFLNPEYRNDIYPQMLGDFLRETGKPLLTGAYSRNTQLKETYNGLFLVGPNGDLLAEPYHKSILLAFGEYMPFAKYLPFLRSLVPAQSDFGRGQGPAVMSWDRFKVGAQICYEGLYPDFSASLSRQGSDIFVNVTNDSWFGKRFEPYQHLYMTFARAIEFRRPLVRATNTGISTAILANGEILSFSPQDAEWTGLLKIRYLANAPHTPYEKIVWIWPYLLAFSLVLLVGLARGRAQST